MANLIVYYSRKGQNYWNGSIVDLAKGNTERVAEFVQKAVGGDDAAKAQWFALNRLPDLAFDHAQIIARALSNTEVKAELL